MMIKLISYIIVVLVGQISGRVANLDLKNYTTKVFWYDQIKLWPDLIWLGRGCIVLGLSSNQIFI